MTAQVHDPVTPGGAPRPGPAPMGAVSRRAIRRWWPLMALVAAAVVGVLVAAGVLSLSAVTYAGLIGGMFLMHAKGHGHGGHGVDRHGSNTSPDPAELRRPSSGSQVTQAGFGAGLDERAVNGRIGGEADQDDSPTSHVCH